jgi:hypothetical protein
MKLLTKSIKDRLIKNYYKHKEAWNDEHPEYVESKAVVKLFNPYGRGDWYLSEMDPETGRCFGLCMIHEPELGYVMFDELESLDFGFGGVERDKFFEPNKCTLDECRTFVNKKYGL